MLALPNFARLNHDLNTKTMPRILLYFLSFIIGFILNTAKIFDPLKDYELFDDAHFWTLPDESPKKDLNETAAVEMTMLENDK